MPTLRENDYAGFGFLLSVEDGPGPDDSGRVVGGFSEVSGLGMDANLSGYRDGNGKSEHVRKIPGIHKFGVVTLKRGVIGDTDLFEWFNAVDKDSAGPRQLRVTMLDEARNAVATIALHRAQPTKCVGPALAAKGGGAVAIEELSLAHEGIERIGSGS